MASYQIPVFGKVLPAASDLSEKQFHYVADNGSGKYSVAGGATGAIGAGFLQNVPLEDESCEVMTIGGGAKGVSSVIVSGPNIELKADAAGTLSPATTAGDYVSAISNEAAAAGSVFEIRPVLYIKHA